MRRVKSNLLHEEIESVSSASPASAAFHTNNRLSPTSSYPSYGSNGHYTQPSSSPPYTAAFSSISRNSSIMTTATSSLSLNTVVLDSSSEAEDNTVSTPKTGTTSASVSSPHHTSSSSVENFPSLLSHSTSASSHSSNTPEEDPPPISATPGRLLHSHYQSSSVDHQTLPDGVKSNSASKASSRHLSRRSSVDKLKPQGGDYCLNILFGLTMLGYFDRYLPAAMKDHLKEDLHLTDAQTSFPFSVFLVVFMIASPIFASFADYGFDRRKLILVGVVIWSLATCANAICGEFWEYLLCRGGVGIGEAALVTIAPTLLCDFYPPEERNRVFAWYSMATPFGAGLGFIIGGFFADQFGWRYSFFLCGVPGLLLAFLMLTVKDPGKGVFDRYDLTLRTPPPTWKDTLWFLAQSKRYVTMNVGYTLGCFAVGALADWFPTFLERKFDIQSTFSGAVVGIITIISTPIGVFGGSYIADKLRGKIKEPNFAVSSLGSGLATALAFPAFLAPNLSFCITFIFFAETFLWFFSAPWNTELSIAVPSPMRARGFGVAIFMSHAFGDAIASSVIGMISDWTHNLRNALLLVPIMVGLASLVWAISSRCLDDDPHSEFYSTDFEEVEVEEGSPNEEQQPLVA